MHRRVVRYPGSAGTGCLALLLTALVLSPAHAADLIINLEEPVDGGTSSGVSNIRGWAVASDGIARIEVYFAGWLVVVIKTLASDPTLAGKAATLGFKSQEPWM